GWEQPRWLNHIALRAREPEEVTEFYIKVFELKGVEESAEDGSVTVTDGKVRLVIRPCHDGFYRSLRQGFDHLGFKVESVEKTKKKIRSCRNEISPNPPKKNSLGDSRGRAKKKTSNFPPRASFCPPTRRVYC